MQENIHTYDEFHVWLAEEKEYLLRLKAAAKTNMETLEMEYVQKLVNLSASKAKYQTLAGDARRTRGATYTPGIVKAELARRHGRKKVDKDLDSVQELERLLEIVDRWTVGSPKWKDIVMGDQDT
ncbi:hypothetical protein B0H14DRAFT_3513417 [Mycena olivaceomarginata]|nr:hypothetical protein B0H14DRAFT_3513417 [Mycena olivaceomarginata]